MYSDEIFLYVHFLYCKSRCPYCDFFKGILPKGFDESAYVKEIIDNLKFVKEFSNDNRELKSVFFGGGTPSLLSKKAVFDILNEVYKNYRVAKDAEITIEANPNTFEREKFLGFREAGVNRLSLGVQALNEKDLKFLGRTHSLKDAREAIDLGVKVFDKFSVDLIYARPDQVFDEWVKEIDEMVAKGVKHISLYQLSIEEGTVFYRKNIKEMDEEKSAKFYEKTVSYLKDMGFERYEVSNFAVNADNRSVHNMAYWNGGDYLGVGKGSAGRIKVDNKFYSLRDGKVEEVLSLKDRAIELIFMGFRIKDGIRFDRFNEIIGKDLREFLDGSKIEEFKKAGLLEVDDEGIRLTDKGFLVMDRIVLDLI